MRNILKLLIFWLAVNILAGLFVGLVFGPFFAPAKWAEHSLFLMKLFIGVALFWFAGSEFGVNPRNLFGMPIEDKLKDVTIAFKYFLLYAGFLVLSVGVLAGIFAVLDAFTGTPGGSSKILGIGGDILRLKALSSAAPGGAALFLLSTCVFAPIIEELFYRRLLFSELRKLFGFFVSMSFSSLVFGFFHASIIIAVINGAYLAYVYEKKKNLLVNVLLHLQLNILSIGLMIAIQKIWA
jgi:membrane protease YdiL (CAAX protease family)